MREPHSARFLSYYNKDISIGEEPTQEVYFMSLVIAQDLLRQYNKKSPYTRTQPIDSTADQSTKKFGTWSYANMYDALYEKYSQNKNFNVNMWHQAIKLGEQDQYLAFLEQNKDNTLSEQFYDPQYYDYEAMMLEMYKPFADATNLEERFTEVYDPASQKWVEESLGEMSDQQYIQYQLNQTREARAAEITKDLEQWRKDQLGWWGQFGHDVLATLAEFGEGLLSGLTGIIDFVAAVGTGGLLPYAMNGFEGNYLDAFVDYFGENGLTAAEKRSVRAALDEYERTHTHFRDIDGNMTGVGKYVAGIANSIGMMVPAIIVNYFTGGVYGLAWMGTATFYASIFSNNMYENATDPSRVNSPSWLKITNAAVKTGVEAVIEWGLGKMLGGTIQNQMIGIGGRNIGASFIKGFSKTSGLKYFFKSAAQEGLEEFLQDFSTNCVDQFTDLIYEGYGNTGVTFQTLIDSFCIGVLSSMFMGGGRVAFSATSSAIRNAKNPGSGDLLIETENGPQKVTSFNRLQYAQILSDFQQAVNELKHGKMSATKNIGLAQEVYGAVSAISQFYSSFDAERIKNCEMLLDRVVKAEKFEEHYERAASILSPETVAQITKYDKMVKQTVKSSVKERARTLAGDVETTFRSMVGGVALRHAEKLRAAADEKEEVLKKAGVTEATAFIDTDGVRYQKDPDMAELEERLGKKAVDNIEELRKGYEWVITTDGHIAVETDGYLFVSEAWLQNYTVSDIYKYLEQTRVLQALTTDKTLAPMVKKLIAFDKEFTGQTDVDAERAMMDLLFNKSVYQAFLLSNGGKNVHEFKHFIFQLHEIVKDLASRSKYHQQLFKGKQAQTRINMLNQIYEQIKETMREPTIKAILNWHFDPQTIGADSVLTQRDREVINKYEQRRRVLANAAKTGKDTSAYEHLAEDIIAAASFNEEELAIVRKSFTDEATEEERTQAVALLEEADRRITTYDFDVSADYSNLKSKKTNIVEALTTLVQSGDTDISHWQDVMNSVYQALYWIDSDSFSNELREYKQKLLERVTAIYDNKNATTEDYSNMITLCLKMLDKELGELSSTTMRHQKQVGMGAFVIPYQAAALVDSDNAAGAQFVTDQLNEFKRMYGISARQMIMGDLTGMSMQQRNQLTQDMEILEVDNYVSFVIKKLEGMFGGNYIVSPTYSQMPETTKAGDFTVMSFDKVKNNTLSFDMRAEEQRLIKSRDEALAWLKSATTRMKSEDAYDLIEEFYEIAQAIQPSQYSTFNDYLPADASKFWKELDTKLKGNTSTKKILSWLISQSERIEDIYNWTGTTINEDVSYSIAGNNTDVYDFVVVKKVPAEAFLSDKILNEDLTSRNDVFIGMFKDGDTIALGDILNLDMFSPEIKRLLSAVTVRFADAGRGNAGKASGNTIYVDPNRSENHFGTLAHETNHILQRYYDMPGGFNVSTAMAMPDFLAYVANTYSLYVAYALRRDGYNLYAKSYITGKLTESDIEKMPRAVKNVLATCGYMLVQGELWARTYMHNGKPVHGFTEQLTATDAYLLAPDGKTKFKLRYSVTDYSSTSFTSDMVAGSALDIAIQKLFELKALQEKRGYANTSRNTYHSNFTKGSAAAMTQKLMSPTVPMMAKYTMKLTDIIKNPTQYLAPEILELCKGDYSEGNVFYRIKEYVEANYEGISIDRKDTMGDEYIFVDDNAFDDLLLSTMRTKATSDSKTLAQQYGGQEVPLTKFYSSQELARLGVHPKAFVVIASNVKTETRFDAEHRVGAIFIKADENTTDAQIIDKLNHEFRHMLQYYNGFETGFTPDFKVSQEMIDDVKKHVPGLFRNETVVRWAKTRYGKDWETGIVQHFVYLTVGGELNAYAFNASELYIKPSFVNKEGGNPTIFMPWYDAKTGEGRYQTEFLAMRADDEAESKKATLPRTNKRPKNAGIKVESLDDVDKVRQYVYTQRRDFTAAKAKSTNLQYFVKKGQRNQMDPDLQEFVIATTGHEDKLPSELVNAIKKGILTKQALFKWFRQVKTVNDFTFDLLNKYMFKNNYITSMAELDTMLTVDPSFYWAAAVVLRKEGLALESLLADNDVDKFLSFMNSIEGTKWKAKIEKLQAKFDEQWIGDGKGGYKKENIGYSDRVQAYMRVLAMQWFDGTLAGAFYMANAFRKTARLYEEEVRGVTSIDAAHGNAKGDKELTLADTLTEDDALSGDNRSVANDILAIYEGETNKSEDEMVQELALAYYQRLCKQAGIDPMSTSKDKLMPIAQKVLAYQKKLFAMPIDEISRRYAELTNSQMTDTKTESAVFDADSKQYKNTRVNVVARIKRTSTALLKLINEGKIAFTDLPKEVQDMFTLESATTESGKKTQAYVLKPDVYSVGRGRKKLPGATDTTGRLNYAPKHNITEGNEAFRHDITAILANDELLRNTLKAARQEIATRKSTIKKTVARGEQASRSLVDAMRKQKTPKSGDMRTTEFKVTSKKKKRTSDTPNVFNIVSGIDMPYTLRKIFDTSFEEMANTEVQFASRDESGQLYDKSQFKPGEFDSRVKHEVSNWDAFYEANRDALLSLTRNDVLDIVEFFQRGMGTIDGPANKLAAFEIFLLGYIVDGARRNFNNWNFSDAEIEMIEKLYEQKASAHGSGLQAVQQMLKVVDPMKKVRQRMFDDWEAISDDDKDKLIEAVDDLQRETDADARIKKAEAVMQMLDEFGERQRAADKIKYPRWSKAWWGRVWSKVKSYRYMAMLSGPTTWIRNVISNVIVTGFNKTSDVIGGIIFTKKGYRKEQWNLAGTKISTEAKTFIDTYILSNPVFDPLYDMSSKYDSRQSKKVADERGLLVTLIAKAYEKQYAQGQRFDSGVMNGIAKFIDKMISDKKFVKFVAGRYFGKILTIEAQRGNVDLSQGLSSEAMDLFAESVILANQEYMHKRSFGADFLDGIRDKYPKMYEALTMWQPFINSSLNWFAESLKYTPIGLANSIVRACRLEKQITKLDERRAAGEMVMDSRAAEFFVRRDIGKGVLGLMLSVFGIMLASSGRIRIDEDDEKFYMYIDEDIKLDITNLFGSSSVLVGASIAQLWIEQKDGDTASFEDMLSLLTDTMLDGFFATDLLERHKWGGTWDDLLTETESVMRSFVPQMWQTIIACTNNEKIRYSAGFKGMWERWLNTFVPTQPFGNRKINPYTGEVEDKYSLPIVGGLLQKGVLGPKVYWVEVSEYERMCRELGVNKNELTGELTVGDNKYELDRLALNKKYGELNKESLAKIKSQKHKVEMPDGTFKTLSWDKMSDEQRARVISRTMTQNAEIAKVYMWTQVMGKKFYASNSLWQILRQLGITRNVYKGDKGFVE